MARVINPGIRLLPNSLTVLALCSGLSAVQFASRQQYVLAIGAIGVAAVLDSLDGRIARLLDATSKIGAELDSLADAISFGVAPALVIYTWSASDARFGWLVTLLFVVCAVLRLARFNTLQNVEQPPYASEFFVGIPAPAGGLLAMLPLILSLEFGPGWWSRQPVVWGWIVIVALLMISRIPTLSVKRIRVPATAAAPLLVGVGLLAAELILYPLLCIAGALLLYLAHIPYARYRFRWLAKHPEAWDVPARERRAIRRASGSRRLGLRPPLHRVAGVARRVIRLPPRRGGLTPRSEPRLGESVSRGNPRGLRRKGWRRIGLRKGG